jgi:hypothetical protein
VHLSSKPMAYDAIRGLLGEPARSRVQQVHRRGVEVSNGTASSPGSSGCALVPVEWKLLSQVSVEVA